MKSFKFMVLCLLSLLTYTTFGSLVIFRRLQGFEEKRKLYQEKVNRLNKLDVFCSLDTEQKRNDYRYEILNRFQQKTAAISRTLFSLGMPLEGQQEFWLGRAKDCREKGLTVLASQYENFVKFELEKLQNECNNVAVPSFGVAK